MARNKSVKSGIREWLAENKPPVVTGEIWKALLAQFAPVSEGYLRDLLRDAGVPVEQPWAGVRQHSLEELEASLREMLEVYERAGASGDRELARYCRRVVIGAKDRAKFAANRGNEAKQEMVEWMLVWLENPGVFPAWVDARRARGKTGAETLRRGENRRNEANFGGTKPI